MSWDIYLESKDGEALEVPHFEEGGTRVLGGSNDAHLNVTYNYSTVTKLVNFHFCGSLDGKRAAGTVDVLARVVDSLGTHRFNDYWAPTPGNAGHAASILLEWARLHPDGIWSVS